MTAFDRIIAYVATGADGTAYFAHRLIPHGPYIPRSDCSLRSDVNGWLSNRPPFRREMSESGRRRSHAAHFEQMQCVQQKLGQLFQQMKAAGPFDDATILIHGDHGSRLSRVAARAETSGRLPPGRTNERPTGNAD